MNDASRLEAIAQSLALAWRGGARVPSGELDLRDETEARAVQLRTWQLLEPERAAPGGWKVGAKAADAPIGEAPLPARGLLPSGVVVTDGGIALRGIELELALRVACDIDDPAIAQSPAPLARCFNAVLTAIELVETRLADWPDATPLAKQADLQSHHALVLGPAMPWHGVLPHLAALTAELSFNGSVVARTVGGNPAQDLPRLLAGLALNAIARGQPLRAGQVVTTGACTGLLFAPAGAHVRGQVGELPPVELTFSA